jgi:flagellar motor protein MotB
MSARRTRILRASTAGGEARWTPTFADLSALLLGLFVLLVALHEPDPARFAALRAELRGGAGAQAPHGVTPGREARAKLRQRLAAWSRAHAVGVAALRDASPTTSGVWIELDAAPLRFEAGSAELSPALEAALRALPAEIHEELGRLEVGGHASDDEPHFAAEPGGRSLPLARAEAALHTLRQAGARARSVSLATYDSGLPPGRIDPRTSAARAAGRRITLRLEVLEP